MLCRERAAEPGSPAQPVGPQVAQVVDRRAVPVEARLPVALARARPEAGRCAAHVVVASAELPRAAEHGARPRAGLAAAARAAPSSAGARAPFHVHAPRAERPVPPGVWARQGSVQPRVAACEVQPLAAAEVVLPDAGEAQAAAPPDVAEAAVEAVPDAAAEAAGEEEPDVAVVAAALRAVRAALPSALPWAAWASRQDLVLLWPAPPQSEPIVRAMELMPIAWPSTRSWQAALVLVLSCALDPREVSRGRSGRSSQRRSELNQQTAAINKHALGRIVAGFKPEGLFICGNCAVWTRFRSWRIHRSSQYEIGSSRCVQLFAHGRRETSDARRRRRRRRVLRAGQRQFIRHLSRQFVRP
jgi:hypothetical protein